MQVDLSLIRKYDVSGPRYTSYPTALQFEDASEVDYRKAVRLEAERVGRTAPLSLYVHLPFCSTLCYYCACNKIVTRDTSKGDRYLNYLYRELDAQAFLVQDRPVHQLHWGGGTPTFISDEQILALSTRLRDRFAFVPDEEGEFSIEIDPRTVDPVRVAGLRHAGFNRLSMGIQDFDETVQRAVNRKQSYEDTETVIRAARAEGFQSISVDLIYGLPFQSLETMNRTLNQVIALLPDRISLYNYAHLPQRFMPQQRINVVDLPRAEEKLDIFKLCIEKLTEAGYRYIGMDHFARPEDELCKAQEDGSLHRNFQGYSTRADCDLIAMGITGISQLETAYFQNTKTLEEYEQSIDGGEIPIRKVIHVDEDDLLRRRVIMRLICQFRLDYDTFLQESGTSFRDYFTAEIGELSRFESDGLLQLTDEAIVVTEAGRLLIRNICMAFDRHLPGTSGERFSKVL